MSNIHEVKLNLSDAQLKKLMRASTVQLSNADIGVGKSFRVAKKVNTKINRAIRQNKGLRISALDLNLNDQQEDLEETGGDILKKLGIKKAVNKTFSEKNMKKVALQGSKMVASAVLPAVAETASTAIGAYTGNPLLGMVTKSAINNLGEYGINQIPSGNGMRFKKGSAEAKAYMASIRAKKSGGSFRPNGKSGGSFKPNGGSFRTNGGAINEDLLDGHYAVLPNSNMFNGMHSKNGNPILSKMKSTQSLYNEAPRLMPKRGRGLNGKTVM